MEYECPEVALTVRSSKTEHNRMEFGLLRVATALKRRPGGAPDTTGNERWGHLYFLNATNNALS